MDIRENNLRYSITTKGNNDQASLSADTQMQGSLAKQETQQLAAAGLTTDKQATATIAEKIVISGGGGEHEYYTGSYAATPMVTSQTFPTQEKLMAHDFLVHTIPTTETLNAAGGYTFKIG